MPIEFISAQDMEAPTAGQLELEDIYQLVGSHADRLGIDKDTAFNNAMKFAEIVGVLENDGKLEGGNRPQKGKQASSAKGLYQFLDGSVGPAKNRLGRHMDVSHIPDNPNDMTWNQQTLLFLADVLEKKGSDKYMRGVLENANDTEAVREAYYVLHHTKPDKKTKDRTERKLNEPLY